MTYWRRLIPVEVRRIAHPKERVREDGQGRKKAGKRNGKAVGPTYR